MENGPTTITDTKKPENRAHVVQMSNVSEEALGKCPMAFNLQRGRVHRTLSWVATFRNYKNSSLMNHRACSLWSPEESGLFLWVASTFCSYKKSSKNYSTCSRHELFLFRVKQESGKKAVKKS
jgi:hypothetical protein